MISETAGADIRKKILARLEEVGRQVNYPINGDIVNGLYVRETNGQPYPEKGKIGELMFDSKDRSVLICCIKNGQHVWTRVV